MERGIRQYELGNELGFTQKYISGLETGAKNPPSQALLLKIVAVLHLNEVEMQELLDSARASNRKYELPVDAPAELYWMMQRLWEVMDTLRGEDIECIRRFIEMAGTQNQSYQRPLERIKRSRKEESRM